MKEFVVNNLADLRGVAGKIISYFENNKIIAFYGKMGAGKTTFIKAICANMGVKEVVSSPTFSLVNEYHTNDGEIIYHFDFYRINRIEEVYDFGYEEYFFSDNYCFIEWPEKIEPLLPEESLHINIEEKENGIRVITIVLR